MDPIRRLVLLTLIASVMLTEPVQARALFAGHGQASERLPATPTEVWIRQIAVVLRQKVKPATQRIRPSEPAKVCERLLASQCPTGESRDLPLPHHCSLPPPLD